jgi:metal-responsive CopG/Arc/MetJ family transcriptional regulator
MKKITVVLDARLLRATDKTAQRTNQNRSALVREALREHLRNLAIRAMEEQERKGYEKYPQLPEDSLIWARTPCV